MFFVSTSVYYLCHPLCSICLFQMTLEELRALLTEREEEEDEKRTEEKEEEEAQNRGHEAAERIRREEHVSNQQLNATLASNKKLRDKPKLPKKKKLATTVAKRKKLDADRNR